MNEIAFLCDQKADCSGSPFCGKECTHTRDIEHAKNFEMCFESEEGCKYIETTEAKEKGEIPAQKKWHWVHKWYNLFYYCPVCTNPSTGKWDFCPNCGADMRGESDE